MSKGSLRSPTTPYPQPRTSSGVMLPDLPDYERFVYTLEQRYPSI